MTTRIKGFTIVLEKNFREDDVEVEVIKQALQMIKGVSSVDPIVANVDDFVVEQRVKSELRNKFYEFIKKEFDAKW